MVLSPHGSGFSFVDSFEVLESGKRGLGVKWLDPSSPWFADHFPGNPLMPGVLLVECAAQVAGALWESAARPPALLPSSLKLRGASGMNPELADAARPDRAGNPSPLFLAQIEKFRFLKTVRPDQTLEIEVILEKDFGELARFEATLRVGKETVASGKLTMSRPTN